MFTLASWRSHYQLFISLDLLAGFRSFRISGIQASILALRHPRCPAHVYLLDTIPSYRPRGKKTPISVQFAVSPPPSCHCQITVNSRSHLGRQCTVSSGQFQAIPIPHLAPLCVDYSQRYHLAGHLIVQEYTSRPR